ncbi:MAG: hypothetical protein M3Z04_06145, partial [Chloroflexota bacterium]|nr:hypothetical protein [Chloroflexota bacterium]
MYRVNTAKHPTLYRLGLVLTGLALLTVGHAARSSAPAGAAGTIVRGALEIGDLHHGISPPLSMLPLAAHTAPPPHRAREQDPA